MKVKKQIFDWVAVAIGVVAIIFAIICMTSNNYFPEGAYEYYHSYGGDAYTGIQNAAAQAANNILWLSDCIETLAGCVKLGFGFSLLVAGFTLIANGLKGIFVKDGVAEETVEKKAKKEKTEKTEEKREQPVQTAEIDKVEEFKKAKALFDAGYITEEEFESKKKILLGL